MKDTTQKEQLNLSKQWTQSTENRLKMPRKKTTACQVCLTPKYKKEMHNSMVCKSCNKSIGLSDAVKFWLHSEKVKTNTK